MSGFSIEELDAVARGVSGTTAPTSNKNKAELPQPTQEDLDKARRKKVLNPQLQPDAEPIVTAPQSDFSFDMKNLDKQAYQIASGKIETPKTETSSLAKFGQGLAALGDVTVGGVLPAIVGTVAYPVMRAGYGMMMSPEQAAQNAQKVQQGLVGAIEKPFGKAFGVTETAGYKGEATNQLMNFIGENASKGADWLSKFTGVPKGDIESYMNTLGIAVAPATGKGVAKVGQAVGKEIGYVGEAAKTAVEPMQKAFEKVKEKMPSVRMEKAPDTMKGMGAAEVDAARLRQERGNELLVPMGDDMTKSQITRNPADVTFERETAKSPEFGGSLQDKYALQNEKLQRNLQAEVEQTGAEMVGMDAPEFGKVLSETFDTYKQGRKAEVSTAYKAAQDAGETAQPVTYKSITDLITKETQNRPTKKAQNPLYSIVEEELKANDPNGTGMISVNAMEDIRKLINEEADPSKKGTVRLAKQLKEQIDASTENAGGDLYKEARAKNRAFEAEFQDQTIIRDINRLKKGTTDRVVPLENLADKLIFKGTGADVKAVFSTLEKMGPEGQQMANELRGYAADKIRQEATKNVARDKNGNPYVSTYELDKQIKALDKSGKLDFLFGAKQAERYRTLNEFTKDLQTVPQGTVNTSGTTSTLLAALGEMAVTGATTGVPAPVATIATYGYNKYKTGQKLKKVEEYANPKGTKLSDMKP
jgi:hypothetical protein